MVVQQQTPCALRMKPAITKSVFGATCHKRPCAYVNFWVGVGGMLPFLALAHMLDATQDAGLGWGGC